MPWTRTFMIPSLIFLSLCDGNNDNLCVIYVYRTGVVLFILVLPFLSLIEHHLTVLSDTVDLLLIIQFLLTSIAHVELYFATWNKLHIVSNILFRKINSNEMFIKEYINKHTYLVTLIIKMFFFNTIRFDVVRSLLSVTPQSFMQCLAQRGFYPRIPVIFQPKFSWQILPYYQSKQNP